MISCIQFLFFKTKKQLYSSLLSDTRTLVTILNRHLLIDGASPLGADHTDEPSAA